VTGGKRYGRAVLQGAAGASGIVVTQPGAEERTCAAPTPNGLPLLSVRDSLEGSQMQAEMTSVQEGAGDE
jgi:hypothetical protein